MGTTISGDKFALAQPPQAFQPISPATPLQQKQNRSRDLFYGFVGTPPEDQLRLVQQALSQLRESVVITTKELEEPGPQIVYVNPAFTRITGWKPKELIGKNPRILQGPKTTRKTLDRLRAQLQKGEAFEGQDINYRKDGTPFHIDWYIEPLRIAHDLNNVLAPVMIGCEVLRAHIADEDALNFLGLLDSSAKRGAALVKQILSFARGISGANVLVEPRHLIHELATMAKATFPKAIAIVEEAPADIGAVEADATQLHQVLLNLCVNARDAITESGTITMRARREELTAPMQTARGELAPGDYVVLEVSDTGSGIPPEVAAKIFFYKSA